MSLQDKVCIVTGGNSGIGKAVALKFASDGARLAIVGRNPATLEEAASETSALGAKVETFAGDVSDPELANGVVDCTLQKYGRVDVLVNSAGGGVMHKRTLTTTPEDMRSAIDSNLLGTIYFCQAALKPMVEAKQGTIINISSGAARNPGLLGGFIYGAAKAAVNNITAFINTEFRGTGVRASVVMPGEVDTPALRRNRPVPPPESARPLLMAPEDVAEAVYMVANAHPRASVEELVIRPSMPRDTSAETPPA